MIEFKGLKFVIENELLGRLTKSEGDIVDLGVDVNSEGMIGINESPGEQDESYLCSIVCGRDFMDVLEIIYVNILSHHNTFVDIDGGLKFMGQIVRK